MKSISLLPAEIKQYHNSAKKRNIVIIACLFVIVAFTVAYLGLSLIASKPVNDLKAIQKQRAEIRQQIAGLKQYEEEMNRAKAIEVLASEAMGNNPDWASLLAGVFNTIPGNVRIDGFVTSYGNNTGSLSVTGKASSHYDVSAWLTALQDAEGLADVKCGFTAKDESGGDSQVSFELTATLLQGSNYAMKDIGGEGDE